MGSTLDKGSLFCWIANKPSFIPHSHKLYNNPATMFFFRRLGHSDVFNLIHKHNLFDSIQDKIIMLMEFDKEVIKIIL